MDIHVRSFICQGPTTIQPNSYQNVKVELVEGPVERVSRKEVLNSCNSVFLN